MPITQQVSYKDWAYTKGYDNGGAGYWSGYYVRQIVDKFWDRTAGFPNVPLHPNRFSHRTVEVDFPAVDIWAILTTTPPWKSYTRGSSDRIDTFNTVWLDTGWTSNMVTEGWVRSAADALSKVSDQSVDVGTAIGEMGQTIKLIAETAHTIGKSMQHVRKGRFAEAAKLLGIRKPSGLRAGARHFSNNYLKYQYGWKPLVNDMAGAMIEASKSMQSRDILYTVRGSSNAQDHREVPYPDFYVLGGDTLSSKMVMDVSVQTYTQYRYSISSPVVSELQRLGLANPISTAYNLVPLSFVVDWFVNIGDMLEAPSVWYGKTFYDGYQSYKGTAISRWVTTSYTPPPNYGFGCDAELLGKRVLSHYELFPRSGPVPPRLQFKTPSSVGQALSGIALMVQSLGR